MIRIVIPRMAPRESLLFLLGFRILKLAFALCYVILSPQLFFFFIKFLYVIKIKEKSTFIRNIKIPYIRDYTVIDKWKYYKS